MQNKLPARVSIETSGGISTPVLEKDITLPANTKMTFSNYEDNQESVEIHILYGDNTISFDNISLIKFQLSGIPKKPRGKLKIELKISIDTDMILTISATELTAKNSAEDKKIDLSNITPPPVKYRVVEENPSQSFDDLFQTLALDFSIDGDNTTSEGNTTSITDDLGRLVYWLSKDIQFRKLFFKDRDKALEGYALTNSQLQALQIITPDFLQVAGVRRILGVLMNAETVMKVDPSAKRCDACNGLGYKNVVKQTFLGQMKSFGTCTNCNGIGFQRTR
jgi:hypothetical protein